MVAGSSGGDFALTRYNTDGSLDTGFDGDGKVVTDFGKVDDRAYGVAIQGDGKIVAAGYTSPTSGGVFDPSGNALNIALARYNDDGSLGTTFDGDGWVLTDFGGNDFAHAVAIQRNDSPHPEA